MTRELDDRSLVSIQDVEPEYSNPRVIEAGPEASLIEVETLESTDFVRPEPDARSLGTSRLQPKPRGKSRWIAWSIALGVGGIALAGTVDWALGLLGRTPLLGAPAVLATAALVVGLLGLLYREFRALRRLRDVEELRESWQNAGDEQLKRLILRVGDELGTEAVARRAAGMIDDAGPDAARRVISREALGPLDRRAGELVAAASRQGFVIVTASPSPALDAVLLIVRAVRLLREIAVLYGYRPGALALRSMVIAIGRDGGAVAIADAFAEAAAQSAASTMAKVGDVTIASGAAASATGVGLLIGVPLAVIGVGLSMAGRAVGATGGAVGGGAIAAWRLYRFGLMVLVAVRPLPFNEVELAELKARTRSDVLRLTRRNKEAPAQGDA